MDPRSPSLAAPPGHTPAQTKVVIITLLSVRVVSAPLAMARRGQWRSRVTVLLPGRSFESVFNASGMQDLVAQYGDWFSYDGSPRAQIFQRNQSLVQDVGSMIQLMRCVGGSEPGLMGSALCASL